MKLKVCADYSFIVIAFSCQAENCCHPVSEKQLNYLSVQTAFLLLHSMLDRLTISIASLIVRSILARACGNTGNLRFREFT